MAKDMIIGSGQMLFGDCLDVMADIPDGSVDMILCDLPYGTTQNKWDAIIPFEPLWAHYWRVAKPNAAIVLTAAQPFTSALVMSQVGHFKYDWSWAKTSVTGHLNAKKRPMRNHEDVLVFGNAPYYPQDLKPWNRGTSRGSNGNNFGKSGTSNFQESTNYPRSRLDVGSVEGDRFHPTQKPVALFEYLIKTYTNEGETVLDNCSGSGTTAIAAMNSGRRFICIEQDVEYYYKSLDRVRSAAA